MPGVRVVEPTFTVGVGLTAEPVYVADDGESVTFAPDRSVVVCDDPAFVIVNVNVAVPV